MSKQETKAEELIKVNFREIEVENITGAIDKLDFSKELANGIYSQTKDLGEVELAREMYKEGTIELTKEQAKKIYEEYINKFWPNYVLNTAFKIALQING